MRTKQVWYVYRAINDSRKEVYHGVSTELIHRIVRHCIGKTKALKHWICERDTMLVKIISWHKTQEKASEVAHNFEKTYRNYKRYKNIRTAGK